jgi:hypothetical protein
MPSAESLRKTMQNARIVGATVLSILRSPLLYSEFFDVVIVDEAGQINQPAVLGALMSADAFVLVGDHGSTSSKNRTVHWRFLRTVPWGFLRTLSWGFLRTCLSADRTYNIPYLTCKRRSNLTMGHLCFHLHGSGAAGPIGKGVGSFMYATLSAPKDSKSIEIGANA